MDLTAEIEIGRPIEEVFAFVADARNDPRWCPRVLSCKQVEGEGRGPGARFEALHRPTLRRTHTRVIETVAFDPPRRVVWRQADEVGAFTISYDLAPTAGGTLLVQRDEIDWRIARAFVPLGRRIVRRHMRDQLGNLTRLLDGAG